MTGTTVITFLMVFLIQNTQNRKAQATQIKLNAIVLAISGASNNLVALEQSSFEELCRIRKAQEAQRDATDAT